MRSKVTFQRQLPIIMYTYRYMSIMGEHGCRLMFSSEPRNPIILSVRADVAQRPTAAPPGQLNCTIHGTVCENTRHVCFHITWTQKTQCDLIKQQSFFVLSGGNVSDDKSPLT